MGQFFIVLAGALVLGAVVFGVTVLIVGGDQGLEPVEPDGRAVPLPAARPLTEADLNEVRFDVAFRGYRMAQVDQALRRSAYDLGYKEELIGVLEAEVEALRDGRLEEADKLRAAREAAARPRPEADVDGGEPGDTEPGGVRADRAAEADGSEGDGSEGDGSEGDGTEGDLSEDGSTARPGVGARLRGARSDGMAERAGSSMIDLGVVDDAAAEPAK